MLSVIIPVYNEKDCIIETLDGLYENLPNLTDCEVFVVYDSENDNTVPVVKNHIEKYTHLKLLKNHLFPGPSGALRCGFREAKGDHILVCMGDSCDQLSSIPEMLELIKEADIVCPSRYCIGGHQEIKNRIKLFFPMTAGWICKHLLGMGTQDPTNSYKLYSKKLLDQINLTSVISFSVTFEIVVKGYVLKSNIVELPTTWKDRTAGESKFNIRSSIPKYSKWLLLAFLHKVKIPFSILDRTFKIRSTT